MLVFQTSGFRLADSEAIKANRGTFDIGLLSDVSMPGRAGAGWILGAKSLVWGIMSVEQPLGL